MKNRKRILIAASLLTLVGLIATWLTIQPRDPIFHGKPESYWIEHLTYGDEAQVQQWREFGPDGVQVLVRALDGATRPADRLYRRTYRILNTVMPKVMVRSLPPPRMDLTRPTRMNVVYLLSRLSKDAMPALPAMTHALSDEDPAVRQLAITYFTRGEDEHCLLNQLEPKTKKDLLPKFLHAMQDPFDGVRNNAVIALRFYPEQAPLVVPVLVQATKDPAPGVRALATNALQRIDPAAAAKTNAMK